MFFIIIGAVLFVYFGVLLIKQIKGKQWKTARLSAVLVVVGLSGVITGLVMISDPGEVYSAAETNEPSESVDSPVVEDLVDKTPLTDAEFDQMMTAPAKFKGRAVEFYAQVFVEPEKDEDGTYLQAYADPNNYGKNVIIGLNDPSFAVKSEDYIHVEGVVKDEFKGENMMGGTVLAPAIMADSIEVVDYVTAVSPAIKTVEVNEIQDQNGYKITLEKVEFAETETRAYVSIENGTKANASFYTFNTKIVQGSKQFEQETNFNANYEEPQSDLLPGVKTEGIISFGAIDPAAGDLSIIAEGSTDNYELSFAPFEFIVSAK